MLNVVKLIVTIYFIFVMLNVIVLNVVEPAESRGLNLALE